MDWSLWSFIQARWLELYWETMVHHVDSLIRFFRIWKIFWEIEERIYFYIIAAPEIWYLMSL